jgi:hypothetical protein
MFMRSLHRDPLSRSKEHFKALTQDQISTESTLGVFLDSLGMDLMIYDGDAEAFMRELHEHWVAEQPEHSEDSTPSTSASASFSGTFSEGQAPDVFISYASEDKAAAAAIRESLASKGLKAWWDRERLGAGDAYDNKIRAAIEHCTLFIVVISKATERLKESYFRQEWSWAIKRSGKRMTELSFIIPIIVDEGLAIEDLRGVEPEILSRTIETAPGGRLSDTQLKRLTTEIRKIRGGQVGHAS